MKYQIINEELQIASCSIADLTLEQAQQFMEQWEDGAPLRSLTLFFEPKTGLLVLNRDNERFEDYKEIAENYLALKCSERMKILNAVPESIKETMTTLERGIRMRIVDKEIFRALKNHIEGSRHRAILNEIAKRYMQRDVVAFIAFRYGVMVGKRMERARRKRGAAV